MKQNIKKVWLILSMIICLAAVSGCAAASDTDKELDPSVVMTMQQGAQQYLALFSSLTDEQLDQYIIQSEENKDYVMENAFKSWDNVKDDLGAYVSSGAVTVEEGDDGYIARITAAYEQRNMEFTLIVSDDMSEIMASDRELQEQYVEAREETEAVKAEYEAEKAEYEEAQAQLEEERAEIGRQIQANTQELEDLQEEIEKAIQEYEAAEAAEAAAAATIANMIAEYQRKKAEEAAANQSAIIDQMNQANEEAIANGQEPPYTEEDIQNATNSGSSTGGASSTGGLTWPVPCSTRVTSRFGTRSDPFTGQTATHNGIDIDGFNNDGNIIVAAADGTVITASYDGAYGNYVVIDHGDITTLYAHMSGMAVSAGDYVTAGQTIGYLGDTGRATGTHCHFEVFVGGSRVDPASYFSGLTYYNC